MPRQASARAICTASAPSAMPISSALRRQMLRRLRRGARRRSGRCQRLAAEAPAGRRRRHPGAGRARGAARRRPPRGARGVVGRPRFCAGPGGVSGRSPPPPRDRWRGKRQGDPVTAQSLSAGRNDGGPRHELECTTIGDLRHRGRMVRGCPTDRPAGRACLTTRRRLPMARPRPLGDSLTVELSALDRAVLVRIQVPQPENRRSRCLRGAPVTLR